MAQVVKDEKLIDKRKYTLIAGGQLRLIKESAKFHKNAIILDDGRKIKGSNERYYSLWALRKEVNRKETPKEQEERIIKAYRRARNARDVIFKTGAKEGVHFSVLAYTDYADEFIPSIVRWKNKKIDDFGDIRKSYQNAIESMNRR